MGTAPDTPPVQTIPSENGAVLRPLEQRRLFELDEVCPNNHAVGEDQLPLAEDQVARLAFRVYVFWFVSRFRQL